MSHCKKKADVSARLGQILNIQASKEGVVRSIYSEASVTLANLGRRNMAS